MREIKIGVSISLSGGYMAHGSESFEGLNLWVNDANQSGGITIKKNDKKLPINLIYYDDGSSVENCKMLVERLVVKDKVDVLIGPYSSGLTLGAAPIADKYKKTLWNHGGSSDEIFERGFTYIVSTITPASGYLTGVIDMVNNMDKRAKKIAIIYAEDSGFSNSVSDGVKRHGEETGFQIVDFKYKSGENDFSLPLQQLKEESFDIILGAGRTDDEINLVRQIIEHRVHAKAMAFVAAAVKDFGVMVGKDSHGFLGPSQWERGINVTPDFGPTPEEFFNRFESAYGKEPDYTAAQGYNIGLVIQKCIEQTETLDDLRLREIANTIVLKTFYGDFKIDTATGKQVGHKMVIIQWQGVNKFIVYPGEVAEKKPIYPKT